MGKISKKNKYWISEDRYLELVHFCRQYDDFKRFYTEIESGIGPSTFTFDQPYNKQLADRTADTAVMLDICTRNIAFIEQSAKEADEELWPFILIGVTRHIGYDGLRAKYDMPCGRELYYKSYRKFFYILHRKLWFA